MNHEGIGLGLTIVEAIVQQNGGVIQAQSDGLGCGSTFAFSMKLQAQQLPLIESTDQLEQRKG